VAYTLPAVVDDCDANPTIICNPPPNTYFAIGSTTIDCLATDHAGNAADCSFSVTVQGGPAPRLTIKKIGQSTVITWPIPECGSYVLEQTLSLSPTIEWGFAMGTIEVVGDQIEFTTDAGGETRFFRLRQQ